MKLVQNQWHPDWNIRTGVAEPLRLTKFVYNGQPDSVSGQTSACAPSTALLPDGKPIAVLCKKIEQETSDANGAQGFAAVAVGAPRVWTYTYNQWGQGLTETDPSGATTTSTYYNSTGPDYTKGDLQSITDAAGKTTQYNRYDRMGRLLSVTSPDGITTTYSYDLRGRLLTQNVGGLLTTMTYLPTGLLASVSQPSGYIIQYQYDAAHRLTGWSDNRGSSGSYVLDGMGNRTSEQIKDSASNTAFELSRTINAINRVASETAGGTQSVSYQYDANGDLIGHTNALNHNTTYILDALRRQTAEKNPLNANATLGYNALDAITQAKDFKGVTTKYTRDAQGNALTEASPDIGSATSSYDSRGLAANNQDASGRTQTITRDALGRPTGISYGDGTHNAASSFVYD